MADFNNVHMCRDFDTLKSWAKPRGADNETTWNANAQNVLAGKFT